MKIITWNIGNYSGGCSVFCDKFRVLRELIQNELPDVFCIIEGTQSQGYNRLLKFLFKLEGYSCYYDPSIPKDNAGEFDWNVFNPFGLKVFYKNNLNTPPLEPSSVLFNGRLLKVVINNNLFIFLHRNMSATIYDQDQFIRQIKMWVTSRQKDLIQNVFILGDFNLPTWDERYFSENSGYIRTSIINRQYEIRSREESGVDFFNPIIQTINKKNLVNLGGTYYNINNSYGWAILDYVLVKNWDSNKITVDLLTSFGKTHLINFSNTTKKYINYGFDHIPVKLNLL